VSVEQLVQVPGNLAAEQRQLRQPGVSGGPDVAAAARRRQPEFQF
jgi:hypothetical protein